MCKQHFDVVVHHCGGSFNTFKLVIGFNSNYSCQTNVVKYNITL